MVGELSHLDERGNARMVDVGAKASTDREAVAEAVVVLSEATLRALMDGSLPKGDAVAVARVAAIQAVKRTADLIPLCHPLPLSAVEVDIEQIDSGVRLTVTVRTTDRTGVEMEALTGVSVGALTIYDMVKGLERGAEIGPVRLLRKSGGASGTWER
ncbi:MAG: cyclic pyranopterin monophosphate synthase MoaC [Acidobacteria bacterium]|nr:cyclic pyranopterin monophosphate synthase MoaC [Acidobacteriota bacterium]